VPAVTEAAPIVLWAGSEMPLVNAC
jgi:hypothetical protein